MGASEISPHMYTCTHVFHSPPARAPLTHGNPPAAEADHAVVLRLARPSLGRKRAREEARVLVVHEVVERLQRVRRQEPHFDGEHGGRNVDVDLGDFCQRRRGRTYTLSPRRGRGSGGGRAAW